MLGSDGKVAQIGETQALVMRRCWPVLGTVGMISRADLRLTPDTARGLRSALGLQHLVINAETEGDADALRASGFVKLASARVVAELPLDPSTDLMAARLGGKWRNRLRHGLGQGLVIRRRPLPPDPRHWIFAAEARQARKLGYRPLPPALICAMIAQAPGAGQIFTAYRHGQKVAAMVFLRHGAKATYQIGWSNEDGRKVSAGPVLMWRAMVDLQSMGTDQIDLGSADAAQAPGLTRFKLGTGAQTRRLGGTWIDSAWSPRWHRFGHRLRRAHA
ncbi:GNAT family N-acetyltransferase [Gymnodinialimonas sp. 2305UL16-5]|uniref:GNAT family N-acetyltransferase n=1 Tax=Gymnodinialimonas mytili TaxID=3126503 RepID=UPI0030959059